MEHQQKETADRVTEGGAFSSGMDTLTKSLKMVFMLLVAAISILLVWFFTFSGFFTVAPDTAVITLRFGEFRNLYTDSWHWVFPYPVSTIVKVPTKPQSVRSSAFMPANKNLIFNRAQAMQNGGAQNALTPGVDGYLITADACIIHTEWEMVYRIADPKTYYERCMTPELPEEPDQPIYNESGAQLGTRGPQTLLRAILDDSILRVTANWKVNDILYDKTFQYTKDVETLVAKRVAGLNIGINVENVALRAKSPPPSTIDAFDEVLLAEQAGASATKKAETYATEQDALARSESTRIISEAQSYRKSVVAEVEADAIYFKSILAEFKKSPSAVTVSLFSTVVADAMAGVKDKFILNSVPGGRQELRLKLNPEPSNNEGSSEKKDKEAAK